MMHYQRARRGTDMLAPKEGHQRPGEVAPCSAEGCSTPPWSRGLCQKHYRASEFYRRHGLTPAEREKLLNDQDGKCASCGCAIFRREDGYWNGAIDHDHGCHPGPQGCAECVRAVLCRRCNQALGLLDEDPAKILCLMDYIIKHTKEN